MTKLPIKSKKALAHLLGVRLSHLENIVAKRDSHFTFFEKKDGEKIRKIYEADWVLSDIHKRIDAKILGQIDMPREIQGGVKGRSLKQNAEMHTGKKNVCRFDIKNFYPSVKARRITSLFATLGCAPDVARLLAHLVTVDGKVPHGFSTSSKITNMVLFSVNKRLQNLFAKYGLTHSFWVDDLTVSGAYPIRKLRATVFRIFEQEKLLLNPEKSGKVKYQSERQVVTKMIVNRKVSVRKEKRQEVRRILHLSEKRGIRSLRRSGYQTMTLVAFLKLVSGKISYLMSIDREKYEPWKNRWEQVLERDGLLEYSRSA